MHTYTKIYVHVTFATRNRIEFLKHPETRQKFHAYLASTARTLSMHDVTAGGFTDHAHLVGAAPPSVALSEIIGKVKSSSSRWLSESFPLLRDFEWQRGFAAFSVSPRSVPKVCLYIETQEEHHATSSFEDELRRICEANGVAWSEIALL